jgi:hypothetical protein
VPSWQERHPAPPTTLPTLPVVAPIEPAAR